MAKPKWKFNVDGFAKLRNHPKLVTAMESGANSAATGTPFDVEVEVFPHQGRRSGPRTSVQIWAKSAEARRAVNDQPGELTEALNRVRL